MSSSAAMYSWSTRDCASSWTPTDLLLAVQLVEVLSVTVLLLVGIALLVAALDAVLPVLLVTVLTLVGMALLVALDAVLPVLPVTVLLLMALLVAASDAVLPILSLTTLPLMEQLAAAADAVMGCSPESLVETACAQQTSLALSSKADPSGTVM